MAEDTVRTLLGVKDPQGARIVIWDTKDVSIGRSPENDIVVEDSDASRRHALLSRIDGEHMLEDLGTFEATKVNGESVRKCALNNRDVIQIANMEITFIESRKDPAALGLDVVYASQLKGFAGSRAGLEDPSATTMGFIDIEPASDDPGKFKVGSVGAFDAPDSEKLPDAAVPLDVDAELAVMANQEPAAESSASAPAPAPQARRLSLRVEIDGLSPELTRAVTALLGKVIELPPLKIRLTGDG
jgi:pSer/pThr/pTyr-binding forkhead associated (FHA) protein